jgi:hypothetical protein
MASQPELVAFEEASAGPAVPPAGRYHYRDPEHRTITGQYLFRNLKPVLVNVTGGESWRLADDGSYSVSKTHLVSGFDAATNSGDLTLNSDEPEVKALLAEAADFRVSFSSSGAATFNARSGRHDDLLLAVCLAVWWANMGERRLRVGTVNWG